jgi:N-acetylglucosamine-6-phosphate deacetylase
VTLCALSRVEAVAALTAVPARALGLGWRFGLLESGYAADVVVLDDDLRVTAVWAAGSAIE